MWTTIWSKNSEQRAILPFLKKIVVYDIKVSDVQPFKLTSVSTALCSKPDF